MHIIIYSISRATDTVADAKAWLTRLAELQDCTQKAYLNSAIELKNAASDAYFAGKSMPAIATGLA
jgi:hypothetical protein